MARRVVPSVIDGDTGILAIFSLCLIPAAKAGRKAAPGSAILRVNRDHIIFDDSFRPRTFRRIDPAPSTTQRAPVDIIVSKRKAPHDAKDQPPAKRAKKNTQKKAHGAR